MNSPLRSTILALLLSAAPLAAQSPVPAEDSPVAAAAEKALVDSLSDADLDRVLPLLQSHYASSSALSPTEIKRASVQGLLGRLGPGVTLLPKAEAIAPADNPFRSEILDNRVGYVRLGALSADRLPALDAALKNFPSKGVSSLVLDLRATSGSANFELAADVCERFCAKGKALFTVRRPSSPDQTLSSKADPLFHGVLAVLTAQNTSGDGELIAGDLQTLAAAMVIGERTKGGAAEFADFPLSDGKALHVAVAEAVLPAGQAATSAGIRPDLPVEISPETTNLVLAAELEKGASPLILETERARVNEAALVAGTNPELDAMISAQRNHSDRLRSGLHDVALQRAMDFVTSVAIYEKGVHAP